MNQGQSKHMDLILCTKKGHKKRRPATRVKDPAGAVAMWSGQLFVSDRWSAGVYHSQVVSLG